MKKLIWVFVLVIFAIFPMYAHSAVVGDDVVEFWTGLTRSSMVRDYCKINNPGNAVIGLEKSICTGGMVSSPNCQIGAGSAMMMLTNLMFWGVLLLYGALLVHGVCSGVSVFDLIVGPQQTGGYDGIRIGGVALRAWPLGYYGTGEDPFWSIFSTSSLVGLP